MQRIRREKGVALFNTKIEQLSPNRGTEAGNTEIFKRQMFKKNKYHEIRRNNFSLKV